MSVENRKVSVIGLGASGLSAAHLALQKGGQVYVSDLRSNPEVTARGTRLRSAGAFVELGGHDLERLVESDIVVVSPGIPPDAAVLRALRERGIRPVSEPEFAYRFFQSSLIAVTGTNGKTTVAALTAHLLSEAGVSVALGGNIGASLGPAASELALLDPPPDWLVVEMSSFQLADVVEFQPDIGVVTSLAPDHLDRYESVDAYYADKARLFQNAVPGDRWVLHHDSDADRIAGDAPGERYYFGAGTPQRGAFLQDDIMVLDAEGTREEILHRGELPLLGTHNVVNALAAALTARLVGIAPDQIAQGLRSFAPLPHRLQVVLERDRVLWVNDSKATNVAATCSAIASLDAPLVLLLGGKDKGEDLTPLQIAVRSGVRRVVTFGEAGKRIDDALQGGVPLEPIDSGFVEAVEAARVAAQPGDILLLSPACSSFDMFTSYEARGERFMALARGEE